MAKAKKRSSLCKSIGVRKICMRPAKGGRKVFCRCPGGSKPRKTSKRRGKQR